jgi:hypothetical protein
MGESAEIQGKLNFHQDFDLTHPKPEAFFAPR